MGAEPVRREKRALEVHTEDPGPRRVADRHLAHRGEHLLLGARDQRRQVRGDTGLEQRVARAPVSGCVRVEEVHTPEAVHLQIDEPRDGEAAAAFPAEPERGDPAVHDLDVPGDEHPVDQRCFDSQPSRHRTSLEVVP